MLFAWQEWIEDVEDESKEKELIQFELNTEDVDEINILQTNLKELGPKLDFCFENHQKTRKVSKDILKMFTEMTTSLKNSINILILNKIK